MLRSVFPIFSEIVIMLRVFCSFLNICRVFAEFYLSQCFYITAVKWDCEFVTLYMVG